MVTAGIVYLVGAGPGDPGCLTLRGHECLSAADVVVYDYLANDELLRFAPAHAERVFAGKHGAGPRILEQEEINRLLVARARAGLKVVRLKGGDPMLFGRGGEEAETRWWVLVEARGARDQAELLKQLELDGRTCKAVTKRGTA